MKGRRQMGRTMLISVAITVTAGLLGLLFNMVNPNGIDIVNAGRKNCVYSTIIVEDEAINAGGMQGDSAVALQENDASGEQTVEVLGQDTAVGSAKPAPKAIAETEKLSSNELTEDKGASTEIELITLFQAKEYFDKGEGFFVDARSEYKYYELHIPGALSLSASRFDSQYEEFKDAVAKDALLIIYCHSITCPYSDIVASKLRGFGYTNIKIFADGWIEWLRARYPVQGFKVYS
ncbi:MAG: rhodanese-like domain-containing protein [Chlorobiales bacterium]|nr:rhodanese-like domain-containing protein [Chlorobiales bacterium]